MSGFLFSLRTQGVLGVRLLEGAARPAALEFLALEVGADLAAAMLAEALREASSGSAPGEELWGESIRGEAYACAYSVGAPRVVVALEGDPERGAFLAESIGAERWNGWARPFFGVDEAQRIASTFPGLEVTAGGIVDRGSDGEADPHLYLLEVRDGRAGYALGAGGWCWLEVDSEG